MKSFLKYTIATLVGICLFLFLSLWILGSLASSMSERSIVKEKSVLKISLSDTYQERNQENPFEGIDIPIPIAAPASAIAIAEAVEAIRYAKEDERIQAVYLEGGVANSGFAFMQELHDALLDFKGSGKKIYAYGDFYSELAYWVASVADSIFLHPVGEVELNGLVVEVVFMKRLFDKLGVQPLIFRVGDFKSAVEPFSREQMSEENRLQLSSYLNSIYNIYLEQVSQNRNISLTQLRRLADSMLVRTAEDALRYGLITHIGYIDQMESSLRRLLNVSDKESINYLPLSSYIKAKPAQKSSSNRIAIIIAEGEIVDNGSEMSDVVGDKVAAEIRRARQDEKVKAIVLRINSPGGSLLASEKIWREVKLTKGVKPIVASMSHLAASGGYYIAMGCDTIVARPTTLTGSIGIFGILLDAQQLLNEKIGITTDRVTTGPYADIGNPTRHMREDERAIIQASIERGYQLFTSKAAEGRNLPLEKLLSVASGRVWSGLQAKEHGLVDVLGSYEDAIQIAARMANLGNDYVLRYYPRQKSWFERWLASTNRGELRQMLLDSYRQYYAWIEPIEKLKNWQGIQARLPFELVIK